MPCSQLLRLFAEGDLRQGCQLRRRGRCNETPSETGLIPKGDRRWRVRNFSVTGWP
jgi:hypothetical protein